MSFSSLFSIIAVLKLILCIIVWNWNAIANDSSSAVDSLLATVIATVVQYKNCFFFLTFRGHECKRLSVMKVAHIKMSIPIDNSFNFYTISLI